MKVSKMDRQLTISLTLVRGVGTPTEQIREVERRIRPEQMTPGSFQQMMNSLLAACIMGGKSPLAMGCSSQATDVKVSKCSDGWYVRFTIQAETGGPYTGICGVVV